MIKPESKYGWTVSVKQAPCGHCGGTGTGFLWLACMMCNGFGFYTEERHEYQPVEPVLEIGCGIWLASGTVEEVDQ